MTWAHSVAKVNNLLRDSSAVFDAVDNTLLFERITRKFQENYQLHLIKIVPQNRNFTGHNL